MIKRSHFLLLGICFLLACSEYQNEEIIGSWQGVAVLEEGTPLEVDPQMIKIYLGPNGEYSYYGTLNYVEAGTYYIEDKYLYTTDTINQASTEKVVEIVLLKADSMYLRMNEAERERILKLKKVN